MFKISQVLLLTFIVMLQFIIYDCHLYFYTYFQR